MYCPACGKGAPEDARFCATCGRALRCLDAPLELESSPGLPAQQPLIEQAAVKKQGWKRVVAVVLIAWFSLALLSFNASLVKAPKGDLAYSLGHLAGVLLVVSFLLLSIRRYLRLTGHHATADRQAVAFFGAAFCISGLFLVPVGLFVLFSAPPLGPIPGLLWFGIVVAMGCLYVAGLLACVRRIRRLRSGDVHTGSRSTLRKAALTLLVVALAAGVSYFAAISWPQAQQRQEKQQSDSDFSSSLKTAQSAVERTQEEIHRVMSQEPQSRENVRANMQRVLWLLDTCDWAIGDVQVLLQGAEQKRRFGSTVEEKQINVLRQVYGLFKENTARQREEAKLILDYRESPAN